MSEVVNSPSHYTHGQHEAIDFISGWGYGFCFGNVVKYLTRYKHKGGRTDLQKALYYFERGIQDGEIGFKKVGPVSAVAYVERLDVDKPVKEIICQLHRGIHMKQRQYITKAARDLEDFLATVKLTSGDGKKIKDRPGAGAERRDTTGTA